MPSTSGPLADRPHPEPFGPVTLRAVVLGLITVLWMCFHADYEMQVTNTSIMTLSNYPVCALIAFVIWVILNAFWRAVSPRSALKPTWCPAMESSMLV